MDDGATGPIGVRSQVARLSHQGGDYVAAGGLGILAVQSFAGLPDAGDQRIGEIRDFATRFKTMNPAARTILLVLLILILLAGPIGGWTGYWPTTYGYCGGGGALLLIVLIALALE